MREKSPLLIVASTGLLLCCVLANRPTAAASGLKWPPANFPKQRDFGDPNQMGQDFEVVEPLGRIVKLNTLFDPTSVEALSTKFTIHTRLGSSNLMAFVPNGFVYSNFSKERFHYNLTTMAYSNFDTRKRTVVIISGFLTDDYVHWMERVKDLWLQLEDCNVIIVTWKEGNRYVYSRAAATTPRVARQITVFLHYLVSMQQQQQDDATIDSDEFASRVQFIGHSLGSHIGGFVGQDFRGKMGRIMALDPAGPSFDRFKREHRIDQSDARLVEAIHTNSGRMKYASFVKSGAKATIAKMIKPLLRNGDDTARSIAETFSGEGDSVWFGIDLPVGHVDYFANNGKTQPGCTGAAHLCDHGRSHDVYEGILQHELALRQQADTEADASSFEQWRKDKRLLAINGADYGGFASGETLNQHCPAMLHSRDRLNGLAEQQMVQCTLPIDQMAPVDQLTEELGELYGISFDKNATSSQRYYFKTLAMKPFAGDHYLLRIKLERSSLWDKSCALQADISFVRNRSTTIELDKDLRMFTNGKFFGLTLPFVNPNGAKARVALDKMLSEYTSENKNQNKHELDDELEQIIGHILPSSVALKIFENKSQSTLSKWIQGAQPGPKCDLAIESVQVHPLVGLRRSLFARYSKTQPQIGSGTSVKLMSHLEYKARKQTEKTWPTSLTPIHQNHEKRLQFVVIG